MSLNTQAHLVFDEGTITSRYEESIRLRATGPSLKEYIRKKHKWKASIMESIDWRSHGQALKRNKQRQTHLVKFIHNILPTTGLQNKFDGGTRSCPLCPCRHEDRDHIFRCPHPTRATWRINFLDNIRTYCEVTNTYPPLFFALGWMVPITQAQTLVSTPAIYTSCFGDNSISDGASCCKAGLRRSGVFYRPNTTRGHTQHNNITRTLASRFDHKDMGPVADVMEQSKSGTIRQRRIESTKSPKYRDSSTTLSNLCYTRHDGTQRPNIAVGYPRGSFTISNACHKKLAINAYSHLLRERETSEVQGTPRSSIHPIIF